MQGYATIKKNIYCFIGREFPTTNDFDMDQFITSVEEKIATIELMEDPAKKSYKYRWSYIEKNEAIESGLRIKRHLLSVVIRS